MVPASESKRGAVIDHDICDRGFAAVSAGSAWWQRTCRAPTPHTDCEAPLPALYFQSEQHATHAARHHRHSPGFHLSPTRKDLVSSDNNCLTTLGFRLNGYGAQPCGLRPASFRLGYPLSSAVYLPIVAANRTSATTASIGGSAFSQGQTDQPCCGSVGTAARPEVMTAARDLFRDPKQVGNMRPAGSLSLQAIHPDRKTDAADERFFECLVFSRVDQGDG